MKERMGPEPADKPVPISPSFMAGALGFAADDPHAAYVKALEQQRPEDLEQWKADEAKREHHDEKRAASDERWIPKQTDEEKARLAELRGKREPDLPMPKMDHAAYVKALEQQRPEDRARMLEGAVAGDDERTPPNERESRDIMSKAILDNTRLITRVLSKINALTERCEILDARCDGMRRELTKAERAISSSARAHQNANGKLADHEARFVLTGAAIELAGTSLLKHAKRLDKSDEKHTSHVLADTRLARAAETFVLADVVASIEARVCRVETLPDVIARVEMRTVELEGRSEQDHGRLDELER